MFLLSSPVRSRAAERHVARLLERTASVAMGAAGSDCLEERGAGALRLEWHNSGLVARYTGVRVWVRQPVYKRYGAALYRVL